MSNRDYNMIFAGFGGQGILFLAKAVAYAGMLDGREVSWLPSYGPEMRGGTANCSVCLSDEPISSPLVTVPDVLAAMNQPSYHKFIDTVRPGGILLLDSSLIHEEVERDGLCAYRVPATELAEQNGLAGLANMVMLGALYEVSGFCTAGALENGLKNCVPSHKSALLEANLKALSLGRELVRDAARV